jgi:hypothetical protein
LLSRRRASLASPKYEQHLPVSCGGTVTALRRAMWCDFVAGEVVQEQRLTTPQSPCTEQSLGRPEQGRNVEGDALAGDALSSCMLSVTLSSGSRDVEGP